MSSDFLKKCIKGSVSFDFYRKGVLYYVCDNTGFKFSVPIEDCGDACFNNKDKGLFFMRYIRKELKLIKESNNA